MATENNISIHAPRVGSDGSKSTAALQEKEISIHAPRVGSDVIPGTSFSPNVDFNPRSPCGERRDPVHAQPLGLLFQSTLPVWGATTNT